MSRRRPRGGYDEAKLIRTRYTTRELLKRNTRMLAAQQEIFMLSDQIIDRLLVEVVQEMGMF